MSKARIAVFVSGGGTNLQALMDAEDKGILHSGEIVLVVASNPTAFALTRAKKKNIATAVAWKRELGSQEAFEAEIEKQLAAHKIDIIVLAGFMNILSADFTAKWPERIINVHPALIPSFCGKGMYGLAPHVAALEKGDAMLADSLALFEEGTKLIASCSKQLDQAEQKVVKLMKGADGAPVELPFAGEEE
jgi:phosphoribosylglycinamide formyltransferase-1